MFGAMKSLGSEAQCEDVTTLLSALAFLSLSLRYGVASLARYIDFSSLLA